MTSYRPRVADGELEQRLRAIGAVLIEGPKACGKTATASRLAATIIRLDGDLNAREALEIAPETLFSEPTPILFDEWEAEPQVWNQVRRQVDDRGERGLFILTGSATPHDDVNRHSGAGRIGTIRMRPMSLAESGHSNSEVSLRALFDGETPTGKDNGLTIRDLLERAVIGGWPALLDASEEEARSWSRDYLRQIVEIDIPALGARRNPRGLRRLLASLGRTVGQTAKLTELARDVGDPGNPIATATLTAYLDALDRLMLLDDSSAWRPHIRSRARLRTAAVRYFVDPSLGLAAIGVGTDDLMRDLPAAGFHFEAMAVRDLRIYAQPLGGVVDSWRDSNGNEVDAVVTLPDGRWAAFEIKLNPRAVDAAAATLTKFANTVDEHRHGRPAALGVITSSGYAGRRSDGVHVIPVTTLGS
ncbi:ATP-binding protein [Microbacterium sp.]|uniref:ATP-binding protein n=1 Tax=Microbacterium sp. TaxID=51671 RepID=UPI003A8DDCF3